MSPYTITITILNLLAVTLLAMTTAGRLHARLAGEEPTTIRLELATIGVVLAYLALMAGLAMLLDFDTAPLVVDYDPGVLAPPSAPAA